MNKGGRPLILETSPHIRAALLDAMRQGHFPETAAALAGCSVSSLRNWIRRGATADRRLEEGLQVDPGEWVFLEFFRDASKAQAEAEARDLDRLDALADQDWRAVAWKLERRHPDRWGRNTTRVEHDITPRAADRAEALIDELRLDDEARAALDLLAERMEGLTDLDGGPSEPGSIPPSSTPAGGVSGD